MVLIASRQQEYHPVYVSIGNLSNTARQAHGNGILPVVFLPIPKGKILSDLHIYTSHYATSVEGSKEVHRVSALLLPALSQMSQTHF
jgi:hypothetical protein